MDSYHLYIITTKPIGQSDVSLSATDWVQMMPLIPQAHCFYLKPTIGPLLNY